MNKKLLHSLIGSSLLSASLGTNAAGMVESLTDYNINDTSFLKNSGIEVGGWASVGITYASHNGDHNTNAPISFNERINEVHLHQLNLFAEKAVDANGKDWDIGGRVDVMFGADANNTQATGWDNQILSKDFSNNYDLAIPQAYAEIYAPIGNGLTTKVGHFYTSIGYEVVTAPDNFFFSHAYTMLYGEPFTHSGVMFSYPLNDNISISGGAVTGWDNFDENGGDWSFLGGASWTSDDANTSLAVTLITGESYDDSVDFNTTMYSIVLSHNFSEKLHYVFQHDLGVMEDAVAPGEDADWYGINQYLTYDLNDQLSTGIRAEWFRDGDGTRINGFSANYYAVSLGINYAPTEWIKFRPEVRYDWADTNGAGGVFDNGTDDDQVAVAMDFVVTF